KQRWIVVRLVRGERVDAHAGRRQRSQIEGSAASRLDQIEGGQRQRRQQRISVAAAIAEPVVGDRGHLGRELRHLRRRSAASVGRRAVGRLPEDGGRGHPGRFEVARQRKSGDRLVQL